MRTQTLQTFRADDISVIIGRRGHGKTTVSKRLQALYPRRLIFDPMREYRDVVTVSSRETLVKILKGVEDQDRFSIAYQPSNFRTEADFFFQCAYAMSDLLVVVEEVHLYADAHSMPEAFENVVFLGRHRGLGLAVTTQRPARLHKDILSQAAHVFCGQMFESNDVKYLQNFIGKADAEKLKNLEKNSNYSNFLWWRPENGGEIIKVFFQKK